MSDAVERLRAALADRYRIERELGHGDFAPKVSPDGREVAFHSWRSGSRDLYILPLDGGPIQPAVVAPGQQSQPNWSPDGRALTFNTFGIPGGVWVVRRGEKGGWGKPVQRSPSGSWPTWSFDGRWIAFTSRFNGGNLMIVSPDSGAARVVMDSALTGLKSEMPVWSRDSRTLYFNSHDAKGNESFWSVPLSGGTPKLLTRFTDPTTPAYRPEWSVAGDRMYFAIQDRQSDIRVMETPPR